MPFLFPGIQMSDLGSDRLFFPEAWSLLCCPELLRPSRRRLQPPSTWAEGSTQGFGVAHSLLQTLWSLLFKDFQTSWLSLSSKSTAANSTLQESQILSFSYDQVRYHNSTQNENKIKSECPCHSRVSGFVSLFPKTGSPAPSPLPRPESRSFFKNHVSLPSCISVVLPSILWPHKGDPGSVIL